MFKKKCLAWLEDQFSKLTDGIPTLTPSEWAEETRYLPPSAGAMPGYYSFDVTPYLREILDCMDINSPIREVSVMKGAQIGATVGILENTIGYYISQVRSAPMMLVTVDSELALLRLESYIIPMLQHSGLIDLLQSADETNNRKTGKTNKKLEWSGGGFLIPFGARNPGKMRSTSIQVLLLDELDGAPDRVGKGEDPIKSAEARTSGSFDRSRKIVRLSTPLIEGSSRIHKAYLSGDQRKYNVPCRKCGKEQELKFSGVNKETGEMWGLVWERKEDGSLKHGSVRYVCRYCGHRHRNSDKTFMLARGKWIPTVEAKIPYTRSYHLPGLLSPAEFLSWERVVEMWFDAWDLDNNQPKDFGLLQLFYNNILGSPYKEEGKQLKLATISQHRRYCYSYGQIPNAYARVHCEGPVKFLTCAVDVHKKFLAVAVFGWAPWSRAFLVDYWELEGNTEDPADPATWGELRKILEQKEYISDDGMVYNIRMTLVDAGFYPDPVFQFCGEYNHSVYPVRGRATPIKGSAVKEFSGWITPLGTQAYWITVDIYKDRWAVALDKKWNGEEQQPKHCFNVPVNATNEQLKELTVERKVEIFEKGTNRRLGYQWYRPSSVRNELWDLLVYNNAALEMIALQQCIEVHKLETLNWSKFWQSI